MKIPWQPKEFVIFNPPYYNLCMLQRKAFQHTPCSLLLVLFLILLGRRWKDEYLGRIRELASPGRLSSWCLISCCITNIVVWSLCESCERLCTIIVVVCLFKDVTLTQIVTYTFSTHSSQREIAFQWKAFSLFYREGRNVYFFGKYFSLPCYFHQIFVGISKIDSKFDTSQNRSCIFRIQLGQKVSFLAIFSFFVSHAPQKYNPNFDFCQISR